jgi:hypothetical protein
MCHLHTLGRLSDARTIRCELVPRLGQLPRDTGHCALDDCSIGRDLVLCRADPFVNASAP